MYLKYLAQKAKKVIPVKKNGVIIRWKRKPSPPAIPVKSSPPAKTSPPIIPTPPAGIEHFLNDPTTPELIKNEVEPTQCAATPYVVRGYKGGGHPRGSLEYQAANLYVTIGEMINYFNRICPESPVPRWRRTNQLAVHPRAGVDLNAFYDGRSLQFFYLNDSRVGTVYAADAADITAHECGHAILDCYRPDLWNVAFLEVGSFHECFGDFCAMIHGLLHEEMINHALMETQGDLSRSNVISRLAEQFGATIYKIRPVGRDPGFLRSAVNDFKYIDPSALPATDKFDRLAAEVHSFSRVMTGAMYDLFLLFYRDQRDTGVSPIDAAKFARDRLSRYVIKAILNAPVNAKFYESFATTMLWADITLDNRKYHDRMSEIFQARNLLQLRFGALSAPACNNHNHIITTTHSLNVKLGEVVVRSMSQSDNPLYGVEVQLPIEEAHLYDCHGRCCHHVSVPEVDSIRAGQDFVEHLHAIGGYGQGVSTPWEIRKDRLLRTRTCCHF
jgi:hypothetical protein